MQVTGGPAWIDADRFDVAAVAPGNPPPTVMLGPMLRSLLEQRFSLKLHRETKDGPIFKLTIGKSGFRLKPSADRSCAPPDLTRPPGSDLPMCGSPSVHSDGSVDFRGTTMAELSARLGTVLDREVVDGTGLTERFDFRFQVNPADLNPRFVAGRERTADVDSGSSIFTALEQQLGLKIEPARGPVQEIVVDAIQRPSEN